MKEWIITSSVSILAIIALRYVFKGKISLRLQYALWVLVLLRLLVPVSFGESHVSIMNVFPSGSHSVVLRSEPPEYIPNVLIMPSAVVENDGNTSGSGTTATYNANPITDTYSKKVNWGRIAKIIWLIGIAIVGMCLLIFNVRFFGKLERTRYKIDISGYSLPIYKTDAVATPCMYGLLRPAIYVTPEILGNETALRYVLEHETTHWRHKDHIWSLLRCMCLALHWYNPLVWMAATYSIQDAELSCDEATIRRIGEDDRTEYGRTLIGLACAKRNANTLLVAATTMTGSKRSIKERITLIAKKPKMAIYTLVAVLLASAVAVGCTFTGAANNKEDRIIPLTDEEVLQYNQIFEPISFDEEGNAIVNIYNHFFTSYYDKPEDIDLSNFLRYFPLEEGFTDEAEFEMLKAAENWPFGADMIMERMPVPIHKFPAETVNNVLQKYMDIMLDDLNGVATETLIYLKEYNAYYNFTSDFGAGIFYCTHGETQGDIVRLFNKSVMLTLKKRGDDYLFISHQRIEGETEATSAADDLNVTIGIELKGNIPDAVLDYATEFVTQQVDYYNDTGKNPPSDMGTFAITEAKITGLTRINTGTSSLTTDIQMWLLEYRLRPDNPDNVVLIGGMSMEDVDGESWITEWGSTGQPYLVLAHDIDTWERICITDTDMIMEDYGTPEMLERYGNKYTAACMELYRRAAESTDRVFIPNNRYWEHIGNADVNGDGRIESIYLDKSKMEAPNSIITLNICDYNDKVIWDKQFSTSYAGWGQLFLCESDGRQYLLWYSPEIHQGYGTYVYTLFSLENGREKIFQTNTLEFDIIGTRELDIPKMLAFADEINSLLDKSTLLMSSNGGNFHFAISATSLFYERYSWLDENQELYNDNDSLEDRLNKYSKYAVSNRELSEMIFVYKNAVEAYGWFELTTLPTSGLLREYNGNSYAKVNDDNFKTLADLENYLHTLFSDSIANDLLYPKNGTERYCNIDGELYAIPADRGTDITKGEEKYEIISSNADTITFRVTVEILGEWDGNKQPIIDYETHDFTYEKIGDKWVFTTFNLIR